MMRMGVGKEKKVICLTDDEDGGGEGEKGDLFDQAQATVIFMHASLSLSLCVCVCVCVYLPACLSICLSSLGRRAR
jgi:hypothetical protein